jgi:hypothetical protein
MGSNRTKHGGDQEESPGKQPYSAPYGVPTEVLQDLTAVLTQGGIPRAEETRAENLSDDADKITNKPATPPRE